MLPDRLAQDIQSCLGDQLFLAGAPQLLIDEIVINTSEPDAVRDKRYRLLPRRYGAGDRGRTRSDPQAACGGCRPSRRDSASSFREPSEVECPVPCSRSEPCHFETPPPGIARPQ